MGCSTCSKCRWIRASAFCGTKRLTEKQLCNKNGFCSGYEPKDREAKELFDLVGENYIKVNADYIADQIKKASENLSEEQKDELRKNGIVI